MYKYQVVEPDEPCDPIFGQLTHDGILQMRDVGKQLVGDSDDNAPSSVTCIWRKNLS